MNALIVCERAVVCSAESCYKHTAMKIVITGTTSGIGKALALYYAQPGVTLGLIGRRQALLTTTATACTARGATVVPAALDVRDADGLPGASAALHPRRDFASSHAPRRTI